MITYASGPRTVRQFLVASGQTIANRRGIYYSSTNYVGLAVNNCHICGVTTSSAIAATADGSVSVMADCNPDSLFWADIANGTGLATDEPGKCDVYDSTGIDVDSATTGNVLVLRVDTTNNKALVKFTFDTAYQQTGLS